MYETKSTLNSNNLFSNDKDGNANEDDQSILTHPKIDYSTDQQTSAKIKLYSDYSDNKSRENVKKVFKEMGFNDLDVIDQLPKSKISHMETLLIQRQTCIDVGNELKKTAEKLKNDMASDFEGKDSNEASKILEDLEHYYNKSNDLSNELKDLFTESLNMTNNINQSKDDPEEVVYLPGKNDTDTEIEEIKVEEKKPEKAKSSAEEVYFTNLRNWKSNVNTSKPGLFIKGFIQADPNKNSNFGMDLCLTSYDLPTLTYLVYKFIDMLEDELFTRDICNKYKQTCDAVCKQLRETYKLELEKGYVPSFEKY